MEYFHSVTLDEERCRGCINCVKRCPTEAIRVKNGKAFIIKERCIDCGECIRVCPHHAKKAVYNKLDEIEGYEYTVALPAPALYGQFNNLENIDYILNGLLELGFDDVFEVASAAELVSDITRQMLGDTSLKRPIISSACPAIVRMIKVRFPKLIGNLLPINQPVEVAAKLARKEAVIKTGLSPEQIGIFFISPCPAKVTAARMPLGTSKVTIDGVLAINEVYKKLVPVMNKIKSPKPMQKSGLTGVSWSYTGGEATALLHPKYLAADGIENVIKILDEIDNGNLRDIDFVELDACFSGCVGGCLNMENPYIAKTRVRQVRKYLPISENRVRDYDIDVNDFIWDEQIKYEPVLQLAQDRAKAMEIMIKTQEIESKLPGIDCASCGSPSCSCFAQDVATGKAKLSDCVFVVKNQLRDIISE